MILTNIESVPGKNIVEHFGVVSGSTVRAKHVGRDIMASLKNIVGGELKGYTELLQDSRMPWLCPGVILLYILDFGKKLIPIGK